MKKVAFKSLAFILALLMAVYALPAAALEELANPDAALSESEGTDVGDSTDEVDLSTEAQEEHIYEDEELREANVKHFRLDDGSYVAAQYPFAVHTKDEDGVLRDIDNSLSDNGSDFSTSNARIKFAKKINGSETLFTLHDGNYKITMSLNGANKQVDGIVTNNTDAESDTRLQKLMKLEKLSSSIIYPDILDGVDLEYVVDSLNVKENIIVKEKSDSYAYSFTLKLNNLSAELTSDGSVRVFDPETDEIVYQIPAPIVFDSNGAEADASMSYYTLSDGKNGKYTLTVTADAEWMNAEDRAWPITVDPTIYVNLFDDMSDTYISAANTGSSYGGQNYMYAGYSLAGQEYITYWKPDDLPSIPDNAYLTSASLSLYLSSFNASDNVGGLLLGLYEVTSSWTSYHTWTGFANGTAGAIGDIQESAYVIPEQASHYVSFDITEITRRWLSGELTAYGVAIKPAVYALAYANFEATNKRTNMPCMTINYKVQKGLESYWSYSTQDASGAGTGSVNLATGELVFTLPTISTTDGLFGFTPSLVYNSSDAAKYNIYSNNSNVPYTVPSVGYGWRLSVNETIVGKTYTDKDGNTGVKYYVWTDGDGTEHAFYKENGTSDYLDEDGLMMTLNVESDYITIEDAAHNVRHFKVYSSNTTYINKGAILEKITDKVGNTLQFTLNSKGQVTAIGVKPNGSALIPYLTFSYNSSNCLTQITGLAGYKVTFEYSSTYNGTAANTNGGFLRTATFSGGEITYAQFQYTYDSSSKILMLLRDIIDETKILYRSSNNQIYEIKEQEGGITGQTVTYSYTQDITEVRTSGSDDVYNNQDDIITRFLFDSAGRAVSSYSCDVNGTTIYGTSFGAYNDDCNKLKSSAVSGGSPVNYIVNGNFDLNESNDFLYWSKTENVSIEKDFDTFELNALIDVQASGEDTLTQRVKLPTGTYTLSAEITALMCSGVTVTLIVDSLSTTGIDFKKDCPISEKEIESKLTPNITFDVDGETNFNITIKVRGGSSVASNATVAVDNVMLENSVGSSDFSLVNHGSFSESTVIDSSVLSPTDGIWTLKRARDKISFVDECGIDGKGIEILGSLTLPQYAYQTVSIIPNEIWLSSELTSKNTPEMYFMLSAFGRGTHQIPSGFFGLRVVISFHADENGNIRTCRICTQSGL